LLSYIYIVCTIIIRVGTGCCWFVWRTRTLYIQYTLYNICTYIETSPIRAGRRSWSWVHLYIIICSTIHRDVIVAGLMNCTQTRGQLFNVFVSCSYSKGFDCDVYCITIHIIIYCLPRQPLCKVVAVQCVGLTIPTTFLTAACPHR